MKNSKKNQKIWLKEKVADLLSDDDKKNLRNDICLKKAAKFVTSKAKQF